MAPSTLLRQTFSPLATVANAPSQQAKSRPADLMLSSGYHSLDPVAEEFAGIERTSFTRLHKLFRFPKCSFTQSENVPTRGRTMPREPGNRFWFRFICWSGVVGGWCIG